MLGMDAFLQPCRTDTDVDADAAPADARANAAREPTASSPARVPVREVGVRHRAQILWHLLQLGPQDRYLRFGSPVPSAQLNKYVASIDFKRDEVFGIFNRKLQLVAVAHLAAMPGKGPHGDGSSRGRAMEFGVSVLPEGRGKGLGMRLFMHAITHARNQHASHLMIHALSENAPMLRIATKAGATLEYDDGQDAEAWLKLPPDTMKTHLNSSLQSLAAEVIYRVKYRAIHISDWLRMLMSTN